MFGWLDISASSSLGIVPVLDGPLDMMIGGPMNIKKWILHRLGRETSAFQTENEVAANHGAYHACIPSCTHLVGKGYMILDIESIREKVWSTDGLENAADDNDEIEGLEDEFGLHQLHQSMVGEQQRALRDATLRDSFENSIKQARSRSRSLQENSNLFLWALACAQRSGFLEVCGIHPRVLYTTPERNIGCWTPWKVQQVTVD